MANMKERVMEAIKDSAAPAMRKQITENSYLEELGVDKAFLVSALDCIGVPISDDEMEPLHTVEDVMDFCLHN